MKAESSRHLPGSEALPDRQDELHRNAQSSSVSPRTSYLGLSLRTPLVPSASPLTGNIDSLRCMEDAGAPAVVLPSLFQEQITGQYNDPAWSLTHGIEPYPEKLSYLPNEEDFLADPGAHSQAPEETDSPPEKLRSDRLTILVISVKFRNGLVRI